MSTEIPLSDQLDVLDAELRELQDDVSLSNFRDNMADLDRDITGLPGQIATLRQRGYRYKSYLEGKSETLSRKWVSAKPVMKREIEKGARTLQPIYDETANKMSQLQGTSNNLMIKKGIGELGSKIEHLKSRIEATNTAVSATYSGVYGTLYQTEAQVIEAMWLLDEIDQSSFDIYAEEHPVQAVKAKWWRDGKKKGPEGNLYLTDQRLIFEQKEKVATKKVLFIATEKEMVQSLEFEAPLMSIDEVKSSSKGMFGNEDHLDFTFGSGSDFGVAHFHIDGQESDLWTGLVKRVQNGEIDRERYYAEGETAASVDQAEEALADAPEKCNACGASFDAPIAKGQLR